MSLPEKIDEPLDHQKALDIAISCAQALFSEINAVPGHSKNGAYYNASRKIKTNDYRVFFNISLDVFLGFLSQPGSISLSAREAILRDRLKEHGLSEQMITEMANCLSTIKSATKREDVRRQRYFNHFEPGQTGDIDRNDLLKNVGLGLEGFMELAQVQFQACETVHHASLKKDFSQPLYTRKSP